MARFKTDGGVVEVQRATPAVARRLRESLAKTTRLLADFEREQSRGEVSVEVYQKCCKQLVSYMATHMNTSGDFVEQMETVILSSYNNHSQPDLSSFLTGSLYARYNGNGPGTPALREPTFRTDTAVVAVLHLVSPMQPRPAYGRPAPLTST
ncbi:hypothetical protein PInf_012406 [Phytophthora infestans]|nr:hypothetical protein PInf_012406 [Phytophthora infestans]